MFEGLLQPTHIIILLVIALLVLGPKRLPEVGKSIGQGLRGFKESLAGEDEHDAPARKVAAAPAPDAHEVAGPAAKPAPVEDEDRTGTPSA